MTNVTQLPTAAVSPELAAKREELGILHNIFRILSNAQIRAEQWSEAKTLLDYANGKIAAVQAEADALPQPKAPPAPVDNSPAIPDKTPDAGLTAALATRELSRPVAG